MVNWANITKLSVLISILAISIGLIYLYIAHKSKEKESEINNKAYRNLEIIQKNFISRIEGINTNSKQLTEIIEPKFNAWKNTNISKEQKTDTIEAILKEYKISEILMFEKIIKKDSIQCTPENIGNPYMTSGDEENNCYKINLDFDNEWVVIPTTKPQKSETIQFRIKTKDLIGNILRKDFFNNFIILYENNIIHSTINAKISIDSILKYNLSDTIISGKEYNVYTLPVLNSDWSIMALKLKSEIKNEVWKYSQDYVTYLMCLLILSGLAIPISISLKSKFEMVSAIFIITAWLSFISAISITIVLVLDKNSKEYFKYHIIKPDLEKLSKEISSNLKNELQDNYEKLNTAYNNISRNNRYCEEPDTSEKSENKIFIVDSLGNRIAADTCILAQKTINNHHKKKILPKTNYLSEEDLNKAGPNRFYLSAKGDTGNVILKPFHSEEDHLFSVNIYKEIEEKHLKSFSGLDTTKDSTNKKIALYITTQLKSVVEPIIHDGYGFFIVDEKGLLWFNNDTRLNLQESILQESPEILNYVKNKSTEFREIIYKGKQLYVFTTPVNNYPLTIITWFKSEKLNSQLANTLIITIYYVFVTYSAFVILTLLLHIFKHKNKILYGKIFDLNHLVPLKNATNAYFELMIIHTLIIIILISSIFLFEIRAFYNPINLTIVLIITYALSYLLIYNKIRPYNLFTGSHNYLSEINIAFASIILIINIFALASPDYFPIFLYQLILSVFIYTVYIFRKRVMNNQWINNKNQIKVFNLFTTIWILSVSIIPPFAFYKILSEQEFKLETRKSQIEFLNSIADCLKNNPQKDINFRPGDSMDDISDKLTRKIYLTKNILNGGNGLCAEEISNPFIHETDASINIPYIQTFLSNPYRRSLSDNSQRDSVFRWNEIPGQYSQLSLVQPKGLNPHNLCCRFAYYQMDETLTLFNIPFWTVIILLVILLYLSFKFFNKTFIFFNPREIFPTLELDQITEADLKRIFVIRGVFTSEDSILSVFGQKNYIPVSYKWLITEYLTKEGQIDTSSEILKNKYLITDFEDIINNKKDIGIFKKYLETSNKSIVILSDISPQKLIQELKESLANTNNNKINSSEYFENNLTGTMMSIVENFYIYTHPHTDIDYPCSISGDLGKIIQNEFKPLNIDSKQAMNIIAPRNIGNFNVKNKQLLEEEIIFKIQNILAFKYNEIWNKFTPKEKFILFDIADDNMVNFKNYYTILNLSKRGVIKINDRKLTIMNKSFKNFIMTQIDKNEIIDFKDQIITNRKAYINFKIIISLVLILIIAITYMMNSESSEKFKVIIPAIASLFPLLADFFNFVRPKDKSNLKT